MAGGKSSPEEEILVNVVGYGFVGMICFGLAVVFFATYWPYIAALTIAVLTFWFFFRSSWARERNARRRTADLLFGLSELDLEPFPDAQYFAIDIIIDLALERGESSDRPVYLAISRFLERLYREEGFTLSSVGEPPGRLDGIAGAKYREAIERLHRKLSSTAALDVFRATAVSVATRFLEGIPDFEPGARSFPVQIASIPFEPTKLDDMIMTLYADRVLKFDLFDRLRAQLDQNLDALPKRAFPSEYSGPDVLGTFLHDTAMLELYRGQVDFAIPEAPRFEHMHVIAGTGHGKTQTLQRFILEDMRTDAGLVIIDSQEQMLGKIANLATDKELILIDPTDIERPPSLNMFDVSRLRGVPQAKREQFLNGLIELLEYVFAGLLKAELTQKQNVLFRYTLRLMLAVPGATLLDLVRFLAEPGEYLRYTTSLGPVAQDFFNHEFKEKSYTQTREQIRRRLYGVLENDAFRRMFSSKRNLLNVAEALNRGAVILVDTAKSHLKADASSLMGRYFIALTLQAAMEREGSDRPAFLYIDEAGEYFDDNIDSLLNEARKRRVGIIMAHQYLDQLTPQLRSSIATNTSIKFAGGVSDKDARALASDMRTEPAFISAQRKGHFAAFLKNVTNSALSIEVPFGTLEAEPKKTADEYERFFERNRNQVSERQEPPQAPSEPRPAVVVPTVDKDEDIKPS